MNPSPSRLPAPRRAAQPFGRRDVRRLTEFFDGDIDAAYSFVRTVWLPDAVKTHAKLAAAVSGSDASTVVFLCDHLREGARSVGSRAIMEKATDVETAFLVGQRKRASQSIDDGIRRLSSVETWFERRGRARASRAPRRSRHA